MSLSKQLSKGARVPKVEVAGEMEASQPEPEVPRVPQPEELFDFILPIRVRPTLNSMFGVLNGGISTAIDYLRRHARHPEHGQKVQLYLEAFDAHSPTKRDKFDMEKWAHELEIDPSELCGWITGELHRFGRETAGIIMEASREFVAQRVVKEAFFNEDTNMLERLAEKHGLLNPKQPQTQVNVRASANSTSDARAMSMQDAGLPNFGEDMSRAPSLVTSQLVDEDHLLSEGETFTVDFSNVDEKEPVHVR